MVVLSEWKRFYATSATLSLPGETGERKEGFSTGQSPVNRHQTERPDELR